MCAARGKNQESVHMGGSRWLPVNSTKLSVLLNSKKLSTTQVNIEGKNAINAIPVIKSLKRLLAFIIVMLISFLK